jgi:hypothetical protein
MKKTVIATLLTLFTINMYAQENAGVNYGFRLGLTAHPTFGFIKAEGGKSNGVSLGFSYGLIGDFNFAENYSFSTGLTITTINGKSTEINPSQFMSITPQNQSTAYNIKYMMQYVEIPLTIKLKTTAINGARWFGQFGLSTDIRISAKQDAESNGKEIVNNVNSSDWTRFYRAGLIIGGGGEFNITEKTSVLAGVTLNNGFTNITKNSYSVKNHFVALNFGVFF